MEPKRYYTSSCLLPYRNGGWRGRLKFKKQDGTYGQVSKVMAAKSKRAAQAELRKWREEMEDLAQKKLKLGSMAHKTVKDLLDGYIDMLSASGSIESSTVYDYRGAARLVERKIGGIEFDSLDVTAAQNWINWAVEEGYKPSTIRKSVTLLKAAYRDAVGRLRVIDYSPVDCVRVPKARHREPNALDERERGRLLTFLSIARDCPENVGIYLALLTGMRRGELLALRWRNVDFEQKMLHVKASIGFGENGHYEKEPKNGGSRRSIPLPDEVAGILTRRLTAARAECFKAGVPSSDRCSSWAVLTANSWPPSVCRVTGPSRFDSWGWWGLKENRPSSMTCAIRSPLPPSSRGRTSSPSPRSWAMPTPP